MSEHRFTVYVNVTDFDPSGTEWPDRDEADYAEDALYGASLRDCRNMDGFADLTGTASITDVQYEDSQ